MSKTADSSVLSVTPCIPGWTTLFLAAHKNNVEVAKLLCNAQANVDLRCVDGKTAISVAVQTGAWCQICCKALHDLFHHLKTTDSNNIGHLGMIVSRDDALLGGKDGKLKI